MSKYQRIGAIWLALNIFLGVAAVGNARSAEGAGQAAPDATKPSACKRGTFRIVVDVGHTVAIPGALSARGATEYTFNMKLAEAIKQSLVEAGFDNTVLLITATAPWRGLMERANRANAMHANLFIAVHHDLVPDQLIETWQYDGQENHFSDRFSGFAIFVSNENPEHGASLTFGHLLGKNLQARGLHYTPHYTLPLMGRYRHPLLDAEAGVYRYDQLLVLRHTSMPAVLLEAGSIVNRQEELELATAERRTLTANAITDAAVDFCEMRSRLSGEPPPKRASSAKPIATGRGSPAGLAR